MRLLRALHRYAGTVVAVIMLLLAVTGGVLIFKDEIWRLQYPALRTAYESPSPQQHAAAFKAIVATASRPVTMVRTPRPGLPAYHVYLQGAEALVDARSHVLIDEWAWYQSPASFLLQLHMRLAAGDTGKQIVGVTGLLGGLMALSGLYLWWPVRRQFQWRSLWPKRTSRIHMLRLHRDLGVLAAVLVLLFSLTGAGVVFGQASRSLFSSVLWSETAAPAPARVTTDAHPPAADAVLIARAQAALPGAQLMSWSPATPANATHYFRFRQAGEPHPFGRSTVHISALDGRVLSAVDATLEPRGERAANWMYPLHAVTVGGWPYRLLALLAALALAVISFSGMLGFVRSLRNNGGNKRPG